MEKILQTLTSCLLLVLSLESFAQDHALYEEHMAEGPAFPVVGEKEKPFVLQTTFYSYQSLEDELEAISNTSVRKHLLDIEVALRLHLFEHTYSYYSEAAPGAFSGQKVIHKPIIYHCIYKIEKHYRKQLRLGEIDGEEASRQLKRILDKSIILYHYDTEDFEGLLKDTRSVEEMIRVFRVLQII
jgi:hypothetical protein